MIDWIKSISHKHFCFAVISISLLERLLCHFKPLLKDMGMYKFAFYNVESLSWVILCHYFYHSFPYSKVGTKGIALVFFISTVVDLINKNLWLQKINLYSVSNSTIDWVYLIIFVAVVIKSKNYDIPEVSTDSVSDDDFTYFVFKTPTTFKQWIVSFLGGGHAASVFAYGNGVEIRFDRKNGSKLICDAKGGKFINRSPNHMVIKTWIPFKDTIKYYTELPDDKKRWRRFTNNCVLVWMPLLKKNGLGLRSINPARLMNHLNKQLN